jgi:hypothetical protein
VNGIFKQGFGGSVNRFNFAMLIQEGQRAAAAWQKGGRGMIND